MDGERFDAMARALAGGASRRRVLRGLAAGAAGAVAGALGLRRAEAQGCSSYGRVCTYTGCCNTDAADCFCYSNTHCRCICPPDTTFCASTNSCVDTQTDPANCGACGNECDYGETCCDGACTAGACEENFTFDAATCACVCALTSCPTNYNLDSAACECVLCTTCTGPTAQAGFCAVDADGNFACVTTLENSTHPNACSKTCTANSNCGAGWACVRDDACGGALHCHPRAT